LSTRSSSISAARGVAKAAGGAILRQIAGYEADARRRILQVRIG
jgi:hypothetical protein